MAEKKGLSIPFEDLYYAFVCCIRRKRNTKNAFEFDINHQIELARLDKELKNGKYKIGESIAFCVDKPVKREVFAANFRDRIIHHLLINQTMDLFENEFIDDSYSCRVGKGTSYGISKCAQYIQEASENYTKDCYIVKCDLKSFFMSINKEALFLKLKDFLTKNYKRTNISLEDILKLTEMVVMNNPQDNCKRKQHFTKWEGLPKEKSLFYCERRIWNTYWKPYITDICEFLFI